MSRPDVFLTADWKRLVMLNYAVDSDLLGPYVPAGADSDEFGGQAWISLEVNLRFYVRRGQNRGVAFIRELVPKRAVATVARVAFGENYPRIRMSHRVERSADGAVRAEYSFGSGSARCTMEIESDVRSFDPPAGSLSRFITEHYWAMPPRLMAAASNTRFSTRHGVPETAGERSFQERRRGSTDRISRAYSRGTRILRF